MRATPPPCGVEEKNPILYFFFAKFIGKLNDSIPSTFTDRVAISIKIVYEVYLSSSIDSDLISGTDGQSWVITRAIVHERFASG